MVMLTALAAVVLGYGVVLVDNFPYNTPQFIIDIICALGVGSLLCLVFFVGLELFYRWKLDQRREECRLLVTKLLEARLGNPLSTLWRERSAGDEGHGPDQAPAGGNATPSGMESAAQS